MTADFVTGAALSSARRYSVLNSIILPVTVLASANPMTVAEGIMHIFIVHSVWETTVVMATLLYDICVLKE